MLLINKYNNLMRKTLLVLLCLFAVPCALKADIVTPGSTRVNVCNIITNINEFKDFRAETYYSLDNKTFPVDIKQGQCLEGLYETLWSYRFYIGQKAITHNITTKETATSRVAANSITRYYKIVKKGADYSLEETKAEFEYPGGMQTTNAQLIDLLGPPPQKTFSQTTKEFPGDSKYTENIEADMADYAASEIPSPQPEPQNDAFNKRLIAAVIALTGVAGLILLSGKKDKASLFLVISLLPGALYANPITMGDIVESNLGHLIKAIAIFAIFGAVILAVVLIKNKKKKD